MKGKSDLVDILTVPAKKGAEPAFPSKAAAERAVSAVVDALKDLVSRKDTESVTFVGFGSFKRVVRKPRTGINPSTGEKIKIKASKTVTFKASKALKDELK